MYAFDEQPESLGMWEALLKGEPADWEVVFDGYRAQVDWPGAAYWRELAEAYPDAKVILSVRDPAAWHRSVTKTILPTLEARGKRESAALNRRAFHNHKLIDEGIFGGRLADAPHAMGVFARHIAEVQASIPANRLLTYEVSDGWPPLCAFLGVDVPEVPFPVTNSASEFVAIQQGDAKP